MSAITTIELEYEVARLEAKMRGEMDALWIHIRNLELLLLNPIEVPVTKKEWKLDI